MKKYLSFLLLGIFLLFSSFFVSLIETKAVDNTNLLNTNITVPSRVDAVFNADGTNTIGNFEIHNNMLIPIEVDNVTLTGKNGWKVVDENITIPVDSKNFSIAILNTNLKEGINNINIPVPEGTKKSLDIGIRRGAYSTVRTLEESLDMTIDYSFKTKVFHATFDTDEGTAVASIDAINGSTFVIPETSKDYYKFLGWKNMTDLSDEKLYQAGESFVMPIGDVQFKAQYQKNTITFRYHSNGGTRYNSDGASIDTTDIIATETFDFDNQSGAAGLASFYEQTALYMKRTGYHYPDLSNEWIVNYADSQIYQAGSGVTKYLDVAILAGKDAQLKKGNVIIEMYANWEANVYTLYLVGNYVSDGEKAMTVALEYDKPYKLPANPFIKKGNKFLGWNKSVSSGDVVFTDQQEVVNLTSVNGATVYLYGVWERIPETVTIDPNGGNYNGSSSSILNNSVVGDYYDLTNTDRTGYTLNGWNKTSGYFGKLISDKVAFYTYSGGGTHYGTFEVVEASPDNPTNNSTEYKITNTGVNAWGKYAGFSTSIPIEDGKSYIHSFKAKIPKNVYLAGVSNSFGNSPKVTWITPYIGTGEWETYAFYVKAGTDARDMGYVGMAGNPELPFEIRVAESKVFELAETDYDYFINTGSELNCTVTAQWNPISYTIKLNANGGVLQSGKSDTISAKYDEAITLPNDVFLFGFSSPSNFGGYNTKPDGTGTLYSWDNLTVKNLTDVDGETISLYVNWIPTIDFNSIYRYGQQGISFADGENVKNFDVVVTKANGETTEYAMTNGDWARGGFEAGDTVEIKWIDYRPGYEFYNFALCYGTGDESAVGTDGITIISQDEKSIKFKFNKTYIDGKSLIRIKWLNDANTYNITYDLDGGSLPSGQSNPTTYTARKESFTLNNPTKTGYTFAGWEEVLEPSKWTPGDISRRLYESTREAYYSDFISIKAGETYTFSNENQEYGLRYYDKNFEYLDVLNGKGDGYTAPQDGYVRFVAPYYMTNKDKINQLSKMKNASVNQNVTIEKGSSGNRTYVAKWVPTEYSINYINTSNGDNKGMNEKFGWAVGKLEDNYPQTYTSETSVQLPKVLNAFGRTFKGWYDNPELTGEPVFEILQGSSGDEVYYAGYTYNDYNVFLDLDGGTLNNQTGKLQYTGKYDTLLSLDSIPTKNGYDFVGWGRENAYPSPYSGSAIQKVEKYSDNPSKDTEEYEILSGTPSAATGSGPSGLFSMSIPLARGETIVYMFYAKVPEGLELDIIGNHDFNYKKTWLSENQGIGTGKWELYKLEYTARTDGYVSNFGYGRIKNAEKQETIRMSNITTYKTSRESSAFKYGAFSGEDYTYKAIWEPSTYTIKYVNTFNGDNKDSSGFFGWAVGTLPSTTKYKYTINDEITLPTLEGVIYGRTFAGWYDNPEFTGSPITTISKGSTGDKTFYAKWNYNDYSITFDLNGGTIDNLSGQQTYTGKYDSTFSFDDAYPVKEGYRFKGWGIEDGVPAFYGSTITKVEKSPDNPSSSSEYEIVNSNTGNISLFYLRMAMTRGQTTVISFYAKLPEGSKLNVLGNYFGTSTVTWTTPAKNIGTGNWERYECEIVSPTTYNGLLSDVGYVRLSSDTPVTAYISGIDIYMTNPNPIFKFGTFIGVDSKYKAIWEKNT